MWIRVRNVEWELKGGKGYTCGLYIKEWDGEHCWGCRGKESVVHGWYECKLV